MIGCLGIYYTKIGFKGGFGGSRKEKRWITSKTKGLEGKV